MFFQDKLACWTNLHFGTIHVLFKLFWSFCLDAFAQLNVVSFVSPAGRIAKVWFPNSIFCAAGVATLSNCSRGYYLLWTMQQFGRTRICTHLLIFLRPLRWKDCRCQWTESFVGKIHTSEMRAFLFPCIFLSCGDCEMGAFMLFWSGIFNDLNIWTLYIYISLKDCFIDPLCRISWTVCGRPSSTLELFGSECSVL